MKLIIDIDENIYQTIVHIDEYSFVTLSMEGLRRLDGAIRNGKPLPKGHGIFYDVGSLDKTIAELNSTRVPEITRGQCKLIREVIMHLPILVGEDNGGGDDEVDDRDSG